MNVGKTRKRQRLSLDTKVRRILQSASETKELNTYQGLTNAAGGYSACLNQIGEGDDDYQRNGRNIQPKHVYIDYYIYGNASMSEDTGFVACVWDTQPNQTAAGFSTVFDTTVAPPGLAMKLNLANKDRFKVLWLEPFIRQAGATSTGNPVNCRNRKFTKLDVYTKCEYGGTATAVPSTGALLILMGSVNNSGTSTSAQITYNARFAYNDF